MSLVPSAVSEWPALRKSTLQRPAYFDNTRNLDPPSIRRAGNWARISSADGSANEKFVGAGSNYSRAEPSDQRTARSRRGEKTGG
jgi:hypothetical protein